MLSPPYLLAAIVWIGGGLAVGAAERTAPANLCPENAPDGVRLLPRAGCGEVRRRTRAEDAQGFREIGDVDLRVGGRVGVTYGAGR